MSSRLRVLLLLFLIVVLGIAATELPDFLARVDWFEVERVELEGERYLTLEEMEMALSLPQGTKVWENPGPWEERLVNHPLVHSIRIRRRFPDRWVLEIREREPVALLPSPLLQPIDPEGKILPIDPMANRLDLPLVHPVSIGEDGGEGRSLTPVALRGLASEIARLSESEPDLVANLSDVGLDPNGDVVARLIRPAVRLHFSIPLTSARLTEAAVVMEDATIRRPETPVRAVDLRFADQVVVRFEEP